MKNQKISLVRIAAVSSGYSHNRMCASTALYHLSMLLLPCQKAINKSNLAQTALDCGLQKSLNLDHMVCNVISSFRRFHEIYISSPASPDHWITCLHLALSWRIANWQSRMFSHLILHLINLEWRASSTVQSIFGAFNIGYHHSRIWERWMWGLIIRNFNTWRCCCCTFFSVGFQFCRSWVVHSFLGGISCASHHALQARLILSLDYSAIVSLAGGSLIGLDVKSGLWCGLVGFTWV